MVTGTSVSVPVLNFAPAMEKFIHQQNLELYRKLLADPDDKDEARNVLEAAGRRSGLGLPAGATVHESRAVP
jgi:hypothetical protein